MPGHPVLGKSGHRHYDLFSEVENGSAPTAANRNTGALNMIKLTRVALPVLLLLATTPTRADCHWAWHCDRVAGCGFVPFCDSPNDKPGPLQGARLPGDGRSLPLPPNAHPGRKPLPGFKPVNPPPPATPPAGTPDACAPAGAGSAAERGLCPHSYTNPTAGEAGSSIECHTVSQ